MGFVGHMGQSTKFSAVGWRNQKFGIGWSKGVLQAMGHRSLSALLMVSGVALQITHAIVHH